MQLIDIDKTRYRRHLNLLIVACIASLAAGSLAISQSLIFWFPSESGSHFIWNLLGVVIMSLAIAWLLNKYRTHDFMTEVVYVWELKQRLNKINRKMSKLLEAGRAGDQAALIAIHYSYAGSRQLWQLDDNTIVMEELLVRQAELNELATEFDLKLNVEDYDESVVNRY